MTDSTTIVIFGASGDLTDRKLIPALFNLWLKGRLPDSLRIIGTASSTRSDDEFRAGLRNGVDEFGGCSFDDSEWAAFAARIFYRTADAADPVAFERLAAAVSALENGPANRLYYLATPPRFFAGIVAGLGHANMVDELVGWRRVVIEKPFGSDLASARALNQSIHEVLAENQIYRIDHYLGKETVQNILVFRFANTIFEPLWNRNYIDHVQITVGETVGVEHRAKYYDGVGVLRDMFQNHLLQLLTLVAMEPPASFEAEALRNEKVKVLSAIKPIEEYQASDCSVRGQYSGYREEPGVAADSQTATYGALRLYIENWRWQGVPFYLRSGKKLAEKRSELVIQFKCPPHIMFPLPTQYAITSNTLAMCLQPDEGIHLRFEAKVPDTVAEMRSVDMDFHYHESFGGTDIPDAYERLLLDVLHGDAALFTRSDQIELSWKLMDPIISRWASKYAPPLAMYDSGTWGPDEGNDLLIGDGRMWMRQCGVE